VEWTHANIQAFGGDPEQMTLFGQSAGGSSVDMYTYAHPSDPLVKGFIAQSGVALDAPESDGTNFTYVAEQVGCGTADGRETDANAELECMQQAPATAIIEVYNNYNATLNAGKPLSFSTVADNRTRFSNYSDRRSQGLFARVPIIYSTANNEGATLVPYTGPEGTNQTAVDIYTTTRFSCPGDEAAAAKAASGVPVWRLRYFGEWPNLNPLAWLGAYHSSDMPMVFGTSDMTGADTELEAKTSAYMQGAWAAFARDPATGLSRSEGAYGWPRYQSEEKTLVQLGLEGTAEAVLATGDAFACRS
jgi:carboxylesterase type B